METDDDDTILHVVFICVTYKRAVSTMTVTTIFIRFFGKDSERLCKKHLVCTCNMYKNN